MKTCLRSKTPLSELCGKFFYNEGFNFRRSCVALLALICGLLVSSGCTAFERRTQKNTLSENGFLGHLPETERQREFYAALPAYKLYRGSKDGQPFYVYKEEEAGVVYIGNEEDYQRYMRQVRRLVAFYETTEQKMVAYPIDAELQRRWPGSWSDAEKSRN
ncbi:MAG TPA: hypothetical protein VIT23_11185 [Terrimicrobiaceae bacterium]